VHALRQASAGCATDHALVQWLDHHKPLRQMLRKWTIRTAHAPLMPHLADTFVAPFVRHYDVPVLAFQDRFMGATDYLDGIRQSDLTHPIMIGIDVYRRLFLCVVYPHPVDEDETGAARSDAPATTTYVLTVFQRYTNCPSTWCRIGCGPHPILGEHLDTCLSQAAKTVLMRNLYRLLG